MNEPDLYDLIARALDGELSSVEARLLEESLERSPEARAILDEIRRLDDRVRRAARVDVEPAFKSRVLARFHAQVGEQPTGNTGSIGRRPRIAARPFVLSAAAAALLIAFWVGGAFDPSVPHSTSPVFTHEPHAPVMDLVQRSNSRFAQLAAFQAGRREENRQRVSQALREDAPEQSRCWDCQCPTRTGDRLAEFAKIFESCSGRSLPSLKIPDDFEMVAARVSTIEFAGKPIQIPQIVLESETDRLSLYLICSRVAAAIQACDPHGLDSVHGCPGCGIETVRHGALLMLLVSDEMSPQRLSEVAALF